MMHIIKQKSSHLKFLQKGGTAGIIYQLNDKKELSERP